MFIGVMLALLTLLINFCWCKIFGVPIAKFDFVEAVGTVVCDNLAFDITAIVLFADDNTNRMKWSRRWQVRYIVVHRWYRRYRRDEWCTTGALHSIGRSSQDFIDGSDRCVCRRTVQIER